MMGPSEERGKMIIDGTDGLVVEATEASITPTVSVGEDNNKTVSPEEVAKLKSLIEKRFRMKRVKRQHGNEEGNKLKQEKNRAKAKAARKASKRR